MLGTLVHKSVIVAALLATVGCASDRLVLTPSSRLVPLVNSPEPGTAVGRCVHFGEEGPVTSPCPLEIGNILGPARRNETRGRGSHSHGIFIQGKELPNHTTTHRAMATAFELATYNSTERALKAKLDSRGSVTLRRLCSDTSIQRVPVVLREFEGCAITLTGTPDDVQGWTMETLNKRGSFVGEPSAFWAQAPELDKPPEKAKCRAKRVVQVEVLTVRNICEALLNKAGQRPDATAAGYP